MSGPLIVFSGGGTGGHLFPAIAVAQALRGLLPSARFLFLGTQRAMDKRILDQVGAEWVAQPIPRLSYRPWHWPRIVNMLRQSRTLVRDRFQSDPPSIVVGTGGLSSIPGVREALRRGIPTALLNPDAIPGKANRYLSKFVDRIFVQWEESTLHFARREVVQVTGCPVRPPFLKPVDRSAAYERFGLRPGLRVLLVTGASQGARTINEAVIANADFLKAQSDWQVLHLTGNQDWEVMVSTYKKRELTASVLPFTDHMAEALGLADLVISRAGASTLAEITALGKASILMPYPFHKDNHQRANADCLVRASAALCLTDRVDASKNASLLGDALATLMTNSQLRDDMSACARQLGRPDSSTRIAHEIARQIKLQSSLAESESLQVLYTHAR
ncbi:MAG: UDP-N-acetylglucosamine--N-acetylmuramyl-(pentapeptide) pyrophosphoryl-undecaprenol N-acetylglucosamine transferase [Planctomycetota bacterium]